MAENRENAAVDANGNPVNHSDPNPAAFNKIETGRNHRASRRLTVLGLVETNAATNAVRAEIIVQRSTE